MARVVVLDSEGKLLGTLSDNGCVAQVFNFFATRVSVWFDQGKSIPRVSISGDTSFLVETVLGEVPVAGFLHGGGDNRFYLLQATTALYLRDGLSEGSTPFCVIKRMA